VFKEITPNTGRNRNATGWRNRPVGAQTTVFTEATLKLASRIGACYAPLIDIISSEFDVTRGRLELLVNTWLQVDKS
jgi:hypothetical protein